MTIHSLHVLLTYQCNYECDHCFVWGSPKQSGIFSMNKLEEVFQQALETAQIREFYFEGGETFIYYPILVKAVKRASELGFTTGIVTNGYWATNISDARTWIGPLIKAGLTRLEISCDPFHGSAAELAEIHPGIIAAKRLGLRATTIAIDPPIGYRDPAAAKPGTSLTGGGVMFRGRAADKLTEGLPRQPWDSFTTCPYEDLGSPSRVHLDPFGYLHLCQGVVMGNMWERPLPDILATFNAKTHPVVGALIAGGPAQLINQFGLEHKPDYVDACHLCYRAREALRPEFPQFLAPDQMYGVV